MGSPTSSRRNPPLFCFKIQKLGLIFGGFFWSKIWWFMGPKKLGKISWSTIFWGSDCSSRVFFCQRFCWWFRNPANSPVEVGGLSHYLQGFDTTIPGGFFGSRMSSNHQQYGDWWVQTSPEKGIHSSQNSQIDPGSVGLVIRETCFPHRWRNSVYLLGYTHLWSTKKHGTMILSETWQSLVHLKCVVALMDSCKQKNGSSTSLHSDLPNL